LWKSKYFDNDLQLYFDDDAATDHDFRAVLGKHELGTNETALKLHLSPCVASMSDADCADFNFVLRPLPAEQLAADASKSTEQRIKDVLCAGPVPVIAVCYESWMPWLRWRYVLSGVVAVQLTMFVLVFSVRKACTRTTATKSKSA
jgi:hypothetical protein